MISQNLIINHVFQPIGKSSGSIQPRFQLNLVIFRDPDFTPQMEPQIVLPFLWAQVGFNEPSEPMAKAIQFGLAAPVKLPLLIAVAFFVLGGLLMITTLGYFVWRRKSNMADINGMPKDVQMETIQRT